MSCMYSTKCVRVVNYEYANTLTQFILNLSTNDKDITNAHTTCSNNMQRTRRAYLLAETG